MNLEGKTFLITGASKGIGKELSHTLDQKGANLILTARDIDSIELTHHTIIPADLTKEKDIKQLVLKIGSKPIDGLINVAGIGIYKPLEDISVHEFRQSIELNLIAPFTLTKLLLNNIQLSDLSLIMNIGSGAGTMPFKNRSAYCASKFGLRGLTLSLAEEYEDSNLNFSLITLGSTITTFGGKSIEKQISDLENGTRAAFPVEYLANELVKIIEDDNRNSEIILYPSEHGFGDWQKPN